jgi:two-component system, NarL family, sensor histidine kinase UhpB
MREWPTESLPTPPVRALAWRDVAAVAGVTVLAFLLSAHFQLTEALYALTRHWEYFQVDELPVGMFVLSLGLIWLSWKRYRDANRELEARRIAEARLEAVLSENRRLAQENLRIQEVERKHLARELHDELGQYLNAIKLDAVSIKDGGDAVACFSRDAAQSIIRSVDHVHGAVSGMIGRLRPVGLDELGLAAAVEHCVDEWRQRLPGTRFILSAGGNFDDLSEPLTLTVYRLIQEGLTNISKHAHATEAQVALERIPGTQGSGNELRLSVADNGCGMDLSSRRSRFGLSGMRERVEMSGGTFELASAPGQGLRFSVRLPACGNS